MKKVPTSFSIQQVILFRMTIYLSFWYRRVDLQESL